MNSKKNAIDPTLDGFISLVAMPKPGYKGYGRNQQDSQKLHGGSEQGLHFLILTLLSTLIQTLPVLKMPILPLS